MSINYDYVGRSQRANHYTTPPRVAIHCASWYFLQRTFLRLNPRSRHPSDSGRETWVLRRRACGRPVCWWGIQLLRTCIRVEWGFEYDDRDKRGTSLDVRPERTIDSPIWCIYNIIQLTPTHATSFTHTGRGYACPIFGDGVSYPDFSENKKYVLWNAVSVPLVHFTLCCDDTKWRHSVVANVLASGNELRASKSQFVKVLAYIRTTSSLYPSGLETC